VEKNIKLGILANNIVGESDYLAEHGLAIIIQIQDGEKQENYLLDCGKDFSTLQHNMASYGIDPKSLSLKAIILSHGHYDHTGGLKGFLETAGKSIPIIGHPDVFTQRISYVRGFRTISCPFNQSEIREAGGDLLLTRDSVKINDYLMITGEVPRKNKFEKNPHFRKVTNNHWMNDEVDDDLSVIIDVDKESFFLLCGCCHAGLINTLERVKTLTGKTKCYGIMGGLHLVGASRDRINFTIAELKKWEPEVIIPLHCSGREAMCDLKHAFSEITRLLNCGDSFSLQIK